MVGLGVGGPFTIGVAVGCGATGAGVGSSSSSSAAMVGFGVGGTVGFVVVGLVVTGEGVVGLVVTGESVVGLTVGLCGEATGDAMSGSQHNKEIPSVPGQQSPKGLHTLDGPRNLLGPQERELLCSREG